MKPHHTWLEQAQKLALLLLAAISLSACAGRFGIGGDSWKEEVLLHDGQKIIVERYQTYGGRHEIGQSPPVKEFTIVFRLPGSGKRITWTSEYGAGRTDFELAALHILNDTPYLVTLPNLCLSYNKWGRPNPPYVFFKYEDSVWKRIALSEFPTEFKNTNMVINNGGEAYALKTQPLVSAQQVKELNDKIRQPEYKSILRKPVNYDPDCIPMVTNGKGRWLSQGWFSTEPTIEACQAECKAKEFDDNTCPCNNIFEGK